MLRFLYVCLVFSLTVSCSYQTIPYKNNTEGMALADYSLLVEVAGEDQAVSRVLNIVNTLQAPVYIQVTEETGWLLNIQQIELHFDQIEERKMYSLQKEFSKYPGIIELKIYKR